MYSVQNLPLVLCQGRLYDRLISFRVSGQGPSINYVGIDVGGKGRREGVFDCPSKSMLDHSMSYLLKSCKSVTVARATYVGKGVKNSKEQFT